MAGVDVLYQDGRRSISEFVRGLPEDELERPVPATPGWSIRDVVSHLAGDAAGVIAGDFPSEFFASFGDEAAVVSLNRWTDGHVTSRATRSLEEVLEEWERSSQTLAAMMAGAVPWPEALPPFVDRALLTDLGVHQQDLYGALGIERDRDGSLVRVGVAGYVAAIGLRLPRNLAALEVIAGDSARVAGDGEPGATVRASRFELFRALSGRRSPDQIRAFGWSGDPDPYIPYFYPYGIRSDALVE